MILDDAVDRPIHAIKSAPAAGLGYLPHIDGLRALAVLAVVAYHLDAHLLPGGFAGVDIFFVISGFVVTASLARDRGSSFPGFLGRFYSRRLARIIPALLLMLTAATVAYVLLVPRAWLSEATDRVGQAAFWGFSNWILGAETNTYFEPRAEFNPYTHTWSLGVEEQFYLVAPLLVFGWVQWRGGEKRHLPLLAMGALTVASLGACLRAASYYGAPFVFYPLVFRFWELGVGVCWFQWTAQSNRTVLFGRSSGGPTTLAGLALLVATLGIADADSFPWPGALGATLGAVLLIGDPRVLGHDPLRRLLETKPLLWIGQRSYSLYLWHWPAFVLFRWTVGFDGWALRMLALTVAVVLAAVSYEWVEKPIRFSSWLKRFEPRWRIAGLLLVVFCSWLLAHWLLMEQPHLGLSQVTRNADDWYVSERMQPTAHNTRRCEPMLTKRWVGPGVGVLEYRPERCADESAPQLFVLGDSHVGAYKPLFDQISAEEGRIVRAYDHPGCPYLGLINPMDGSTQPECVLGNQAAIADVLRLAHSGDLILLTSLRLPRFSEQSGPHTGQEDQPFERSAKEIESVQLALKEAPRWFVPFLDAGMRVIFEAPKPIFRSPVFRCVDSFNHMNSDCTHGVREARSDEEVYRAPTVRAMRTLASQYPGVGIWDPLPVLCQPHTCDALREGRPLFFDGDHISAYGNAVLFSSFKTAINAGSTPVAAPKD